MNWLLLLACGLAWLACLVLIFGACRAAQWADQWAEQKMAQWAQEEDEKG